MTVMSAADIGKHNLNFGLLTEIITLVLKLFIQFQCLLNPVYIKSGSTSITGITDLLV